MNEVGLNTLFPGQQGTVKELTTVSFEVRQRLLEMGLTKGITIKVVRVAPLGDPIEIELRGYHLSLRRKEAEAVLIQTSNPACSEILQT
jgi:Fe2+ transport system protein FeoA